MAMSNSDKLHLEPNPMGWTAYYDPEGLHGNGADRAAALEDLLEQTDEGWRKALDEHDVTKRALSDEIRKRESAVFDRANTIQDALVAVERVKKERDDWMKYAEQLKTAALRVLEAFPGEAPTISGERALLLLRDALSKNTTDQAGSAKAAGAPGAESTAAPTITHLIAWLDAKGAASTVCKWGDSPGTTIRALLEEYAREKAVLGVCNSVPLPRDPQHVPIPMVRLCEIILGRGLGNLDTHDLNNYVRIALGRYEQLVAALAVHSQGNANG